MVIQIQLIEGKKETTIPLIKLTKSKNKQTGTATFVFIKPKTLMEKFSLKSITGVHLLWNNKKIVTNEVDLLFSEGQPFLVRALFIFKNPKEWFEFFSFMNAYSKETGFLISFHLINQEN
uniref:Photosystem II reaction center Psb28 protein n=1 Tax=Mallomonas splendens TaxID=52552 RepID=A0A3G2QZY6_9STRA|nr:photosystem II protein W [Mallomonas splendens]AYO28522.1 photosystem II protein W [Mallomonas splendens]